MTGPRLALPAPGDRTPLWRVLVAARVAGHLAAEQGTPAEDVPPAAHPFLAVMWRAGHRDATRP